MSEIKRIVIGMAIALLAGIGIGYHNAPKTPEIRVEYVEREVEKEKVVYVDRVIKEKSKETTTKPDGTVIVKETERDTGEKVSSNNKEKTKDTSVTIDKSTKAQWRAAALAGLRWDGKMVYGGSVERRIAGPFGAGVFYLQQDKPIAGASLFVEF